MNNDKRIEVRFFLTESNREPVREWLLSLSQDDRRIVGTDIKTVEWGWPLGMPTCRSLGSGLWEVRSDISDGRTARVLFCVDDGTMYLLTGFIKKTQKTPPDEIRIARRRMKELGL